MKIYIIRHGESKANASKTLQGQFNSDLNESGVRLAKVTGQKMKEESIRFDVAFASPLSRAFDTAKYVLTESGNDDVEIITDERLMEIDVGYYEGKSLDPLKGEIPLATLKDFLKKPLEMGAFPDGESISDVCVRTQEFLHWLSEQPYESVLVASHGCAIRAMLNFLYDDPTDYWQDRPPLNCSVSILSAKRESDGSVKLSIDEKDKIYYDESEAVDLFSV